MDIPVLKKISVENWTSDSKGLPLSIKLKDEKGVENVHYLCDIQYIPEEFRIKAEKELNETPESMTKGIQKLRDYLYRENLPYVNDDSLRAILRCSKYDIEKSKTKLKKFLSLRCITVENLKKVDKKIFEYIIDSGITNCLPYTDKNGRTIFYIRPSLNLDLYDYDDVAVFLITGLFLVVTYQASTINGVAFIIDCKCDWPVTHFSLFKAYRQYIALERNIPLRIGRIDLVNENFLVHYIFKLLRPLIPSEIVDRIAFHGTDFKSLHNFYHPDLLPQELGGNMGPTNTEFYKKTRIDTAEKLKAEIYT